MRSQTEPDHPIESWTDEELLDQYRYIRAELAEDGQAKDSENNPAEVLADEIRRRRLPLPTHYSAASPGREDEEPAKN